MHIKQTKLTFAAVWLLVMCAAAFVLDVTSASAWTLLTAIALLPPIGLLRLWNDAGQTLSESIHEARRERSYLETPAAILLSHDEPA
jgi:hypothetical protein